ncbi:MAG: DUF1289 domain-containing protein [Calditrichia bacterium]
MKNGNLKTHRNCRFRRAFGCAKSIRKTGCATGCLRTLDEIAAWSRLDDAAKSRIYNDLELRKQRRKFPKGA